VDYNEFNEREENMAIVFAFVIGFISGIILEECFGEEVNED